MKSTKNHSEVEKISQRVRKNSKREESKSRTVELNLNPKSQMKKRERRTRIKKRIVAALICIAPLVIMAALFVS